MFLVPHGRLAIAALGAVMIVLPAVALHAQENEVVGPSELRDFQLPGTRTTPAPDVAVPAEPAPAPVTDEGNEAPASQAEPAPPSAVAQADRPARSELPSSESTASTDRPAQRERQDAAREARQTNRDRTPAPQAPAESILPSSPTGEPARPGGMPWVYGLLAALAAAGLFFGIRQWRAMTGLDAYDDQAEPRDDPAPEPLQQPSETIQRPAPRPAASDIVGIPLRPWLKLDFKPARAAATEAEAVVQYELLIKNVGNADAKNVRIVAKMFNAGADQDKEISAFFADPMSRQKGLRVAALPARKGTRLRNIVTMPKEEVREVNVKGRLLFIPMVAFNVVYEWGNGRTGQTSMSYLVGTEAETPSEKMGAFRLDLGPRIYRSVGQRPSNVGMLV